MSNPAGFYPFELTDADRSRAALIALHLERQRREQNARDKRRAEILEAAELASALEELP